MTDEEIVNAPKIVGVGPKRIAANETGMQALVGRNVVLPGMQDAVSTNGQDAASFSGQDAASFSGQDARAPGSAGVPPALSHATPSLTDVSHANSLAAKSALWNTPSRGWHSRGYLPHFDSTEVIQSITFRLADSLPGNVVQNWQRQLEQLPNMQRSAELRKRIANYLDAGFGACWLKDDENAGIVERALLHFDGHRYRLFAWCIMPNHVHALAQLIDGYSMSSVLHSWKSYTAKQINCRLKRAGTFWHADYFDRFIRNEEHFYRVKHYIEDNPRKAGLCAAPSLWRWSSARRK